MSRTEGANKAASLIFSPSDKKSPGKFCFYGRNGAGKTWLACSSKKKTLLVDCEEEGYDAVDDKAAFPNVKAYKLKLWEEKDWIYWHLKDGKHDFEVVVIDTITSLSTICMKWVLGDEVARDSSADPLMPGRQQYGKLGVAMANMIIEWRNLPYTIIFLAQERTYVLKDENEEVTGTEIGPSMTPNPLGTLLGAVGTIGRLTKREVTKTVNGKTHTEEERRLLVRGDEKYIAKTRIRGLKKTVLRPTLAQIMKIRDEQGEVPQGQVASGTGVKI